MHYELEVGARTVDDAVAAWRGGARRVELYASPTEGALSPSAGLVRAVVDEKEKRGMDLDLFVMIRPRAGDMLYRDSEFDIMKHDTEILRAAGAEGFMCGILTPDGDLDLPRLQEIVRLAGGRRFTLHRAFDSARDQFRTLEEAIDLGIEFILTGGLRPDLSFDYDRLAALRDRAAGRIKVMVALGLEFDPARLDRPVLERIGLADYHIVNGFRQRPSAMRYAPVADALDDDYLKKGLESIEYLDEAAVREIRDRFDRLQT